ncbi:DUF6797 domain-containing protein [Aquiflexum sp.]|uniref:DUF6797 domain-containing protein n=1 Tax=Aquiflexum sp. TaxID=1872584 RepID=UPI0035945B0C
MNKPIQKLNIKNYPFSFFQTLIFLPVLFLFFSGCTEEKLIEKVNFDDAEFADFVEPDFPFITTSLDARKLGAEFPDDNIAARVLAIKLGEDAYAAFDTDMLRWAVAWTGDFMPMVTMAQISYRDFHNKDNLLPVIGGDPKIANGLYAGWGGPEHQFADPRTPPINPDLLSWGPLPVEIGRWNGIFLSGNEVLLSYTVGDTEVTEKPGTIRSENETTFTRTIQTEGPRKALTMVAAEVTGAVKSEVLENKAFFYHGENLDLITGFGLTGDFQGVSLEVIEDRYAVVNLPAGSENLNFTLAMWHGKAENKAHFEQMLSQTNTKISDFRKGGPARWKETVLTKGQLSPDTASFVTDVLTLPIPNPWKRNVRVVDAAFFDGGKAALVTFEGDVWILQGFSHQLKKLKWKRFASGLYEPQSIEIVDGKIYVFGKEGIVRIHDLNGDGEADFYENFSNIMIQTIETREWASDMVAAPDGSFYVSKFGALDMGPQTSSPKSLLGFRAGSPHDGSILKISADGRSIETIATGLRGPYLGIHPKTGVLSASDQQGHYMPSTPVMLVGKGDYYGVPATAHLDPIPEITPPLTWIPHREDRSGIGQVWITGDKMGPLNGNMVHLSYGRPGMFRVMIDSLANGVQGGVSVIKGHYPAPPMKGVINPGDGQLYLTGFSLWGTNSSTISAFTRIRYTGMESFTPEKFYVRDGGIIIRFNKALDETIAKDPKNYVVKRWNYHRTPKYGSGHFKPDGTEGEELLPVVAVGLSEDRKALFLAVPDIQEIMQMEVSYNIRSANGSAMEDVIWLTVNHVTKPDLLAEGFSNFNLEEIDYDRSVMVVEDTGGKPSLELGSQIFLKMGCIACHAIDDKSDGKVGPNMKNLFGSTRPLKDGTSVVADEAYILESITKPSAKEVEGYEEGMPSFLGILSDNELESLVIYIKSL